MELPLREHIILLTVLQSEPPLALSHLHVDSPTALFTSMGIKKLQAVTSRRHLSQSSEIFMNLCVVPELPDFGICAQSQCVSAEFLLLGQASPLFGSNDIFIKFSARVDVLCQWWFSTLASWRGL